MLPAIPVTFQPPTCVLCCQHLQERSAWERSRPAFNQGKDFSFDRGPAGGTPNAQGTHIMVNGLQADGLRLSPHRAGKTKLLSTGAAVKSMGHCIDRCGMRQSPIQGRMRKAVFISLNATSAGHDVECRSGLWARRGMHRAIGGQSRSHKSLRVRKTPVRPPCVGEVYVWHWISNTNLP